MSATALHNSRSLPDPGGSQTWKGLTCDRGQALGRSSRKKSLEKATVWAPQYMTVPQPSSITLSQSAPVTEGRAGEAGPSQPPAQNLDQPTGSASITSLPSKPLLLLCQSCRLQAELIHRDSSPGSREQSRLDLPPDARKPWTDNSSCSPAQPRQGQELYRAKIKKSPGLPISYIYQPATAPSGTKVFKHWKESA